MPGLPKIKSNSTIKPLLSAKNDRIPLKNLSILKARETRDIDSILFDQDKKRSRS